MASADENHEAQRAFWNGDAAQRWLKRQEETDTMLAAAQDAALARAKPLPGEHVLDIGCGCGGSTIELARLVGAQGRVVGLDISEAMLERARARTFRLPQVETLCADAARHRGGRRYPGPCRAGSCGWSSHPWRACLLTSRI